MHTVIRFFTCLFLLASSVTAGFAANSIAVSMHPLALLIDPLLTGTTIERHIILTDSDPHHVTITPQTIRTIDRAALTFWIGPDSEFALAPYLTNHAKAVRLYTKTVDIHGYHDDAQTVQEEHRHFSKAHIWMAIPHALEAIDVIAHTLAAQFPTKQARIAENHRQFVKRLTELDKRLRAALQTIPVHAVSQHDAWQPFFDRYLPQGSVQPLTTITDTHIGLRHITELRHAAATDTLHCLIGEPIHSTAAERAAHVLGLPLRLLDPQAREITDYTQWLQTVADTLKTCIAIMQ